jgi:hypothetical protein
MMTGLVSSDWAHGQDRSTAISRRNDQQLQTHFIYRCILLISCSVARNILYAHRQQPTTRSIAIKSCQFEIQKCSSSSSSSSFSSSSSSIVVVVAAAVAVVVVVVAAAAAVAQ